MNREIEEERVSEGSIQVVTLNCYKNTVTALPYLYKHIYSNFLHIWSTAGVLFFPEPQNNVGSEIFLIFSEVGSFVKEDKNSRISVKNKVK